MAEKPFFRRNILALNDNERQQYFWGLKMLGILPSFKGNRDRFYWTLGFSGLDINQEDITKEDLPKLENYIKPRRLHDEFIASHFSCCEHTSFYFSYYHRHLMVQFEFYLNYVHQVLWLTEEEFKTKFTGCDNLITGNNLELWRCVLKKYKTLGDKNTKVMAHYWNPTNYNNPKEIVVPLQLSDNTIFKNHVLDQVDQLYFSVRGHYPWEIDTKVDWYNDKGQKKFDQNREKFAQKLKLYPNYYIYQPDYQPTPEEKQILAGELNPRCGDFKTFYNSVKYLTSISAPINNDYNLSVEYQKVQEQRRLKRHPNDADKQVPLQPVSMTNSMRITSHRNYQKFNSKPNGQYSNKLSLIQLKEENHLVNYGGRISLNNKVYNMQYLKQQQIQQQGINFDKVNYNNLLPHYEIGYALYNYQFNDYVDYLKPTSNLNIQKSHNVMHNNMNFSMMDTYYSITNLLFFPYHTWIDIQVQMKLRLCNNPTQAHLVNDHLTKKSQRQEYVDPILNPKGQIKTYGDYPIMEWVDPRFSGVVTYWSDNAPDSQSPNFTWKIQKCKELGLDQNSIKRAFPSYKYILINERSLRTSLDLKEFYDSQYIPKNTSRLAEFKGFATYNANYDYQMFQTFYNGNNKQKPLTNKTFPLSEKGKVNIPTYLSEMNLQVNDYSSVINAIIIQYRKHLPTKKPLKYYQKLVTRSMLLHIKYSSSICTGSYQVWANFEKLGEFLIKRKYKLDKNLQKLLEKKTPYNIFTISLLSKGGYGKCINCGQFKNILAYTSEHLFARCRSLWRIINNILLKKYIYNNLPNQEPYKPKLNLQKQHTQTIQSDKTELDINDFAFIENYNDQFKFFYVQGAEEVGFQVSFITKNQIVLDFSLQISLEVEDTQKHEPASIIFKRIQGQELQQVANDNLKGQSEFKYKFDFYNSRNNARYQTRNQLDGMIYTGANVNIYHEDKCLSFNFKIKNYHEIVTYKLSITEDQKNIYAVVTDADYDLKKLLFQQEQDRKLRLKKQEQAKEDRRAKELEGKKKIQQHKL